MCIRDSASPLAVPTASYPNACSARSIRFLTTSRTAARSLPPSHVTMTPREPYGMVPPESFGRNHRAFFARRCPPPPPPPRLLSRMIRSFVVASSSRRRRVSAQRREDSKWVRSRAGVSRRVRARPRRRGVTPPRGSRALFLNRSKARARRRRRRRRRREKTSSSRRRRRLARA